MSDLRNEILLRLGKVLLGAAAGALFYAAALALGATGGPELALLSWLSGAALILVLQSPPL
ncbi:MAG: hypothetical protein A2X23_01275 [Chloroflexi bacterium GWC2_73_18]|nr:MAG: hypothetical protein A2X23_01275 [Chloroflexi bacterium GWC2_73_18]